MGLKRHHGGFMMKTARELATQINENKTKIEKKENIPLNVQMNLI